MSLSDKIVESIDKYDDGSGETEDWVEARDVKQAVVELKELGKNDERYYSMIDKKHHIDICIEDIDKIFGEKLI